MSFVLRGMLAGAISLLTGLLAADVWRLMGLPWEWTIVGALLVAGSVFAIFTPPAPSELE